MKPRVAFKVDNKLTGEDTKLAVELRFKSIDDFRPENVVTQVDPLKKLLEARVRLSELLHKLDGNDKLDDLLQKVIADTDSLKTLGKEAGIEKPEDK
jgi:type VI secretion system protein ImpB